MRYVENTLVVGDSLRHLAKPVLYTLVINWVTLPAVAIGGGSKSENSGNDLYRRVTEAALILEGTVIKSESRWREDFENGKVVGRRIYTMFEIRVRRLIKGVLSDSALTLQALGGTVGDTTQVVFDGAAFPVPVGGDAILFLTKTSRGWETLPNGVIVTQSGMVYPDYKPIPVKTFGGYLRVLSVGRKMELDSFLQSLPPPPSVPIDLGGGTVSPDEVRQSDKRPDSASFHQSRSIEDSDGVLTPARPERDSLRAGSPDDLRLRDVCHSPWSVFLNGEI